MFGPCAPSSGRLRGKLGDDADNPACVFTEPRVCYWMPEGETSGEEESQTETLFEHSRSIRGLICIEVYLCWEIPALIGCAPCAGFSTDSRRGLSPGNPVGPVERRRQARLS